MIKSAGATATNFQDLPGDNRFQVQENGSLVIRQAREEDAGYYLCHISNSVGEDSKTATLTVFGTCSISLAKSHTDYTVRYKRTLV